MAHQEPSAELVQDEYSPWIRRPSLTFPSAHLGAALDDLKDGLLAWPFWTSLAWQRIKNRYRRSILGPFWITLSLGVLVATLGVLYSTIMNRPVEIYMPHLALGLVAWQFISGAVQDGTKIFTSAARWIVNTRMPFSSLALTLVHQNHIMMAHHMVIYAVVALTFGIWCGWIGLLALPAVAIYAITALATALSLGVLCARFADLPQVVSSLMRIAFFATPIIWMPTQLHSRAFLADYNPFYHYVEIFRAPLLGSLPTVTNWLVTCACTSALLIASLALFSWRRHRIAYWL